MVTKVERVNYAEVVGYWLRYEYKSRPEFKKFVESQFNKDDLKLIDKRNFSKEEDNKKRYDMLHGYRTFIEWFSHAEWWRAELGQSDVSQILVIHDKHWYKLSRGSLKALDIAKAISSQDAELQDDSKLLEEKRKIMSDLTERAKERTKIVVVAPENGRVLTVIDGVHRAIRLCLYYFIRHERDPSTISQPAYLGLTPDPIEHSTEQWSDVWEFFS